jgi:hypothetical protein
MLIKQLKLLNKCTNYCSIHIYGMLTKFYKCHLYIYKDIKHLVRKIIYYLIMYLLWKKAYKTTKAVK